MFGSILNAAIGYKAAKDARKDKQRQIDAQMAGFNLSKPYLEQMYSGTGGAVDDVLATGTFGNTYTPFFNPVNQMQQDYMLGVADSMQPTIANQLDQFGNFGDYFAQAGNIASQDPLTGAMDYASGDRLDALSSAALRNPYRDLVESTLPGINRGAASSGNINSSRAGVADALAVRAFDDRSADVRSTLQDQLMTQYLNNNNNMIANLLNVGSNQMSGFGNAFGYAGDIGDIYGTLGNLVYQDQVNKMSADKAAFDEARDLPLQTYQQFSNIMSNAPVSVNPDANMYNPAISGITGFMSGMGGGGFGGMGQNSDGTSKGNQFDLANLAATFGFGG